jgi:hypothetical protein
VTFAEQLARLRVAVATGRLPNDLGRWVLTQLVGLAPDGERIALRNQLLREAAALLPGSTWSRARQLQAELVGMARRRRVASQLRALLAEVLELDPDCPRSLRQLLRVLGDIEGDGDVTGGCGTLAT